MSRDKIAEQIDAELQEVLSKASSHEAKVEILLIAILKELKRPGPI